MSTPVTTAPVRSLNSGILMINSERGWRGGEVQTWLTAVGVARAGVAVTVACPPGSPLAERLVAAGIPVLPLAQRGSLDLRAMWTLRRWLARNPVDAVHAHTANAHSVAALALIGKRVPLIVTRRVVFPLKRTWFTGWKYRRAARIIAISTSVAAVLGEGGVDRSVIEVIRDGIDVDAAAAGSAAGIREGFGIPAGAPLVMCIANLSDDKDHPTLLRAWRQVEDAAGTSPVPAHLVLVGGGQRHDELHALVRGLGLSRVVFAGFRSDIPDVMAAADVVVLTSRHEGLGSILMDAQACAKPVVATAAGGIPEVVADGVAGFVVPVGDHAAVAERLLRLLDDPALRQRFGAAGAARAQAEFAAVRLVDAHLALYRRLCGPA